MKFILVALFALPLITHAQNAQSFVANTTEFLSNVIVPFLIGIAFLFLVVNVIRYFVAGAGDSDSREKARALATYGVLAFVVLVVFWGIVNMLADSLGLNRKCYEGQVSDYIEEKARQDGSPFSQVNPCAPLQPSPPSPDSSPIAPSPFNDPSPNQNSPMQPIAPSPDTLP